MPRPSVAIVGRPNVGKSTFFNRLVGRRIAIEDPTSGVTRDRVLHPMEVGGKAFDLIDTGGIGIVDRQDLSEDVEQQIRIAIVEADVILMLGDCRDGVTRWTERWPIVSGAWRLRWCWRSTRPIPMRWSGRSSPSLHWGWVSRCR